MSSGDRARAPAVVMARNLTISYRDETLLEDVSFEVEPGEEVLIAGRSGSGKTSLMLALSGLVPSSGGSVSWPSLAEDPIKRRAQIATVFQAPSLLAELTAGENVALPLRLRGMSRDDSKRCVAIALTRVGLTARHAVDLPSEMSGGEQQRVAVARAIATTPRLLFADEPTGSLDRTNGRLVLAAMRDAVRKTGAALVLATHDEEIAAEFDAVVRIEDSALTWERR